MKEEKKEDVIEVEEEEKKSEEEKKPETLWELINKLLKEKEESAKPKLVDLLE